jgi:arylsulfatase
MHPADRAQQGGTHRIQYFEMLGNRALYKDGWIAAARYG